MPYNSPSVDTTTRPQKTRKETEKSRLLECCTDADCNGSIIEDKQNGEKYCEDCGLVIESDAIDHGPDWKPPNKDGESKSRASPLTQLRHDNGLSTNIGSFHDGYGNTLSGSTQRKFSRLKTHHNWSKAQTSKDRTIRGVITEIRRMASALGIPKQTQKLAVNLSQQLQNEVDLIGHSIESVACTTLHLSTRFQQITRSISEIETVARVDKQSIITTYEFTRDTLDINLPPANPREYIDRYADHIDLRDIYGPGRSNEYEKHLRDSKELIDVILDSNMESGMSRTTIAVLSLYTAGLKNGNLISQSHFADHIDICKRTIRNQYKRVLQLDPNIDDLPENIDSMGVQEIYIYMHEEPVDHLYRK